MNKHEGCGIETSFIDEDAQAQCPACNWKGPRRTTELEAAQDLRDHFKTESTKPPTAGL